MKDLASMSSYDSELYRMFLFDISSCFRYWIDRYIDRCSPGTITSPVQCELSHVIEDVSSTIMKLCEVEATNIDSWVSTLTNKMQGTLPHIKATQIETFIKDCKINVFFKYLKEEFLNIKFDHQLQSEFNNARSIISTLNCRANSPKDILYDRLIGCTAKCPFCKEQCDVATTRGSHSGKHSVSVHRPKCLGTYSYVESKKLILDTCTESPPNETFQCPETNWRPVQYRDYKCIYGDWDIPFRHTWLYLCRREPKYWQWFIYQHECDVNKWAAAVGADFPSHWRYISQSEAISSLEYIYILTNCNYSN